MCEYGIIWDSMSDHVNGLIRAFLMSTTKCNLKFVIH
jgi:hypothetical protein